MRIGDGHRVAASLVEQPRERIEMRPAAHDEFGLDRHVQFDALEDARRAARAQREAVRGWPGLRLEPLQNPLGIGILAAAREPTLSERARTLAQCPPPPGTAVG